jgi:hypothetical protein
MAEGDDQTIDGTRPGAAWRPESAARAIGLMARRMGGDKARISFGDILSATGAHSFTLLILLLAAISSIPSPGIPVGGPFGLIIMLIGLQMILGRHRLWLPAWLTRRTVARDRLGRAAVRAGALLRKIERRLSPRLAPLTGDLARRFLGAVAVILGFLLLLPIPFGNTPPALALVVLALGLMARDGAAVAVGLALGAGALAYCGVWIAGTLLAADWLLW